jgi:hypothetical protein
MTAKPTAIPNSKSRAEIHKAILDTIGFPDRCLLLIPISEIRVGRSVDHAAQRIEPRTMAGTIPRFFSAIPVQRCSPDVGRSLTGGAIGS